MPRRGDLGSLTKGDLSESTLFAHQSEVLRTIHDSSTYATVIPVPRDRVGAQELVAISSE